MKNNNWLIVIIGLIIILSCKNQTNPQITMAKKINYSIPEESKEKLNKLSFEMTKYENYGMYHTAVWSNQEMKFILGFDRGYFDCVISPNRNPQKSFYIIPLLRFLRQDKEFYEKELIEANKYNTLDRKEYVNLLCDNYSMIESFCIEFNEEIFKNYENY